MRRSQPLPLDPSAHGVVFAESLHADDFRMPWRADPFHKLLYVLEGQVMLSEGPAAVSEVVLEGQVNFPEQGGGARRMAGTGSLIVIPAAQVHSLDDVKPARLLLLGLDREFVLADRELAEIWAALAGRSSPIVALSRPAQERLESWWRQSLRESSYPRGGGGVLLRSVASQILVYLTRLPPPSGTADRAVDRVADLVREVSDAFYEDWDLDRAAARAGLSRRRFSQLFREAAGATFHRHLTGLRLDHADRLLAEGRRSITGIIFSCGFGDSSSFYRAFLRRHGCAPLAWARTRCCR